MACNPSVINRLISKRTRRQGASDETVLGGTVRSERRSQHSHLTYEPVNKSNWLQMVGIGLLQFAILFSTHAVALTLPSPAHTEEFTLPPYLQGVLSEHFPIIDIMASGERGLWLISKGSLWLWRPESKGLTQLNLDQGDTSHLPLQVLGTDGIGIFAASPSSLFQIIWPDRRVFRYSLPKGQSNTTLGFSGTGDDFRILHSQGILRFDRYGKTVKLEKPFLTHIHEFKVKYRSQDKTLWRIQGKVLERASVDAGDLKFKMLLKTHYPLLDLMDDGYAMVVHTPYALLRVNAAGKIIRSIPVEGRRSLLAMSITKQSHTYLFSDGLVELYKPSHPSALSARIQMPQDVKIKKIIVEDDLIGILTDKGVRAFRIVQNN